LTPVTTRRVSGPRVWFVVILLDVSSSSSSSSSYLNRRWQKFVPQKGRPGGNREEPNWSSSGNCAERKACSRQPRSCGKKAGIAAKEKKLARHARNEEGGREEPQSRSCGASRHPSRASRVSGCSASAQRSAFAPQEGEQTGHPADSEWPRGTRARGSRTISHVSEDVLCVTHLWHTLRERGEGHVCVYEGIIFGRRRGVVANCPVVVGKRVACRMCGPTAGAVGRVRCRRRNRVVRGRDVVAAERQ
jgi:hypothetical protein